MKLTEHQLKEIYQKSTNRQNRTDCPSADQLYQLLSGTLDSSEREGIGSHLEQCRDCAEEFQIARELSSALPKIPRSVGVSNKPVWRSLLAAAVMIFALTVGITLYNRSTITPVETVDRGEQPVEFRTEPENGARLENAPTSLKWSAIPGVKTYNIVLLNYESVTIAESGPLNSAEFVLREDVRNRIQAGQLYYWRIEYERSGELQSKLLRFNVR